jgi:predicted nucleic acid-binding protein
VKIFLDSSALVKRYVREKGTDRVIEICREADEIAVSIICITEVLSACNRLLREKLITADQYAEIKHEFLRDIESAIIINLTFEVMEKSIVCLEKGTIGSLDALHVAAAIIYEAELFVTGDEKQTLIAEQMGVNVALC